MARWSDLPAELRIEILRYLFIDTTMAVSPRHNLLCWLSHRSDYTVLTLVAKSFAYVEDVISAMMQEVALRIYSGHALDSFKQNLDNASVSLCQLRRLELVIPIPVTFTTSSLEKFKSKLPNLKQISVHVGSSFDTIPEWLEVQVEIPLGFDFDKKAHTAVGRQRQLELGRLAINLERFSTSSHDPRGSLYPRNGEHDQTLEKQHKFTYSTGAELIISEALTNKQPNWIHYGPRRRVLRHWTDSELASARWLALLVTDTAIEKTGVNVVLVWSLRVRVVNFRKQDVIGHVHRVFFSTKDMHIKFLDDHNAGAIPQIFPESLRSFAVNED